MVRRKNPYPEVGEVIVGTVKTVNPNSVLVNLDEYKKLGLCHVSEISRKWVRDIRQFAKAGDKMIAMVMNIDKQRDHIDLSAKRLSDSDKNKRLQAWKRDEKGEKLLEKLAESNGMKLDEAYENIGFQIQDSFRDMLEAFETALQDTSILERRGFDKKFADMIKSTADSNIEIKEKELKGFVDIKSYSSDGIKAIKETLGEAKKKYKIDVRYISAPRYMISFTTKELRKGDRILGEAAEFICSSMRKAKGECEFHRDKEV